MFGKILSSTVNIFAYVFRVYSFLYVIKYIIVNDCFCHLCGVILTLKNSGCDTYMHKTMVSVASLEKIEIIRSQELMLSKVRLKFLKKMIILGLKTAILGPQFCRILVLGPHFWWSGGSRPLGPPGSTPAPHTH